MAFLPEPIKLSIQVQLELVYGSVQSALRHLLETFKFREICSHTDLTTITPSTREGSKLDKRHQGPYSIQEVDVVVEEEVVMVVEEVVEVVEVPVLTAVRGAQDPQ